jgi:hypothetical protein
MYAPSFNANSLAFPANLSKYLPLDIVTALQFILLKVVKYQIEKAKDWWLEIKTIDLKKFTNSVS